MAWQAPSGCKVVRTSYTTRNPVMSYSYLKWCALKWNSPHIGITTLPGTDIKEFAEIRRLLKKENSEYITVTADGFLDEKEIPLVKDMGVMEFFPKGTPFEELIEWSKKNIRQKI